MSLKVINGVKKEKPNYFDLYFNAFSKCVERINSADELYDDLDLLERKRFVYYGVKMLNSKKYDGLSYDELMSFFESFDFIKGAMSQLRPSDLENMFPIQKKYNGKKYDTKDYFYTKKALEELDAHKDIGENIDDILWDYQNWDLSFFLINSMSIVSDIRRSQGQKGLMEEFLDEKNVPYYTMHTDVKGKGYLENSQTGVVTKVQKPKPRYLNIVK